MGILRPEFFSFGCGQTKRRFFGGARRRHLRPRPFCCCGISRPLQPPPAAGICCSLTALRLFLSGSRRMGPLRPEQQSDSRLDLLASSNPGHVTAAAVGSQTGRPAVKNAALEFQASPSDDHAPGGTRPLVSGGRCAFIPAWTGRPAAAGNAPPPQREELRSEKGQRAVSRGRFSRSCSSTEVLT